MINPASSLVSLATKSSADEILSKIDLLIEPSRNNSLLCRELSRDSIWLGLRLSIRQDRLIPDKSSFFPNSVSWQSFNSGAGEAGEMDELVGTLTEEHERLARSVSELQEKIRSIFQKLPTLKQKLPLDGVMVKPRGGYLGTIEKDARTGGHLIRRRSHDFSYKPGADVLMVAIIRNGILGYPPVATDDLVVMAPQNYLSNLEKKALTLIRDLQSRLAEEATKLGQISETILERELSDIVEGRQRPQVPPEIPTEILPEQPKEQHERFSHNDDYSSVRYNGTDYLPTERAAKVIRLLDESSRKGHPWVRERTILDKLGGERLKDTFTSRRNAGLWNTLIVGDKKKATSGWTHS